MVMVSTFDIFKPFKPPFTVKNNFNPLVRARGAAAQKYVGIFFNETKLHSVLKFNNYNHILYKLLTYNNYLLFSFKKTHAVKSSTIIISLH